MLFYNLLLWLLTPVVLLRLLWKSRQNPNYRKHIIERFAFGLPPGEKNSIWIHAVSVGEFLAVRPLLISLLETDVNYNLWLTCTTPTGREQMIAFQKQYPNRIRLSYFPYDLRCNHERALNHIQPQAIILVETEIWINLIRQAQAKNIPVLLINARLSARSLRGYYRFARQLLQKPLQWLKVNAQTKVDARRFNILGVPQDNIFITPNIKYQSPYAQNIPDDFQLIKQPHFQWLAASTHTGEEEIILKAHTLLQQDDPNARLIIAPRHPERRQDVIQLVKKYGFRPILRSEKQYAQHHKDILIVDTLGELGGIYPLINLAFIGGSFIPHGGHNPLEALHAGKPVVFGQSMFNFAQIAREIASQPFAKQLKTNHPDELAQTLQLLQKQDMRESIETYIERHKNIVAAHTNFILNNIGEKL